MKRLFAAILRHLKRSRHLDMVAYGLALMTERIAPWPRLIAPSDLQRYKRVLVLAPHPDDETFGMGGMMILLRAQAADLRLVWLSNKDDDTRVSEALAVASRLGYPQTREESFPVAGRPWIAETVAVFRGELQRFDPDLVCCPSVFEPHYDHARVAIALRRAIAAGSWSGEVLQYEVWSTVVPNVLVDVSDVVEKKEQLMRLYPSQLGEEDRDYVGRLLALSRYRGLTHCVPFAEAFILSDSRTFESLAAPLELARTPGNT